MEKTPRIGIIGIDDMGTHLSKGLTTAGYTVGFADSDLHDVARVAQESDVLVLTVPHDEAENVLHECDGAHEGKILVDVTNVDSDEFQFAGGIKESQAEKLQRIAPGCTVVKAFNTVAAPTLSTGSADGDRLSVFVASDDEESRKTVMTLAKAIGFDAVDAGSLEAARFLEPLGDLNRQPGMKQGDERSDVGFRLVYP